MRSCLSKKLKWGSAVLLDYSDDSSVEITKHKLTVI